MFLWKLGNAFTETTICLIVYRELKDFFAYFKFPTCLINDGFDFTVVKYIFPECVFNWQHSMFYGIQNDVLIYAYVFSR